MSPSSFPSSHRQPVLWFLACGLLAASAVAGAALAQDAAADIDLAAIRARAAASEDDAAALAAAARARADALKDEAHSASAPARAALEAPSLQPKPKPQIQTQSQSQNQTFDFDAMVADAGSAARANLAEAPRFIAFASLALPPASLRQLVTDVTRAGGVVVLRGLPQGGVKALTRQLGVMLDPKAPLDGLAIDPRLFRAFGIGEVPAFVAVSSDFELCDGFTCTDTMPPHDRLSGNVTAAYALETFARGGGPGAKIAALHLARLEGASP